MLIGNTVDCRSLGVPICPFYPYGPGVCVLKEAMGKKFMWLFMIYVNPRPPKGEGAWFFFEQLFLTTGLNIENVGVATPPPPRGRVTKKWLRMSRIKLIIRSWSLKYILILYWLSRSGRVTEFADPNTQQLNMVVAMRVYSISAGRTLH